jgi:hypothetical protein
MDLARPRTLYLTSNTEDYVSDGLVHGLRTVLGDRLVEVPKRESLYSNYPEEARARLYGRGFGLYGLLEDIPIDRGSTWERLEEDEFDLVVIGDIWRSFGAWVQHLPHLRRTRCAVVDGSDSPALYPYARRWWSVPQWWTLPRAHTRAPYFKREISSWTATFRTYGLLPPPLARLSSFPGRLRPIAISYPEEKVAADVPDKTADFPTHVVDPEMAAALGRPARPVVRGPGSYAFAREDDYRADLRAARFGITTKRAGWDALRHYELAAAGMVLCVRNLHRKPALSAPHGLHPGNCISYRSARDLRARLARLGEEEERRLQLAALAWARANSTRARAVDFLRALGFEPPVRPALP